MGLITHLTYRIVAKDPIWQRQRWCFQLKREATWLGHQTPQAVRCAWLTEKPCGKKTYKLDDRSLQKTSYLVCTIIQSIVMFMFCHYENHARAHQIEQRWSTCLSCMEGCQRKFGRNFRVTDSRAEMRWDSEISHMVCQLDSEINHMGCQLDSEINHMACQLDSEINHMWCQLDSEIKHMWCHLDSEINHMMSIGEWNQSHVISIG